MRRAYHLPYLILGGLLLFSLGLILISLPTTSSAAPPQVAAGPTWGLDIQVSPIMTTTPDWQHDITFAIDPAHSNHVLAGYASKEADRSNSGYAWSTDAGRTWEGARLYGPWISNTVPLGNTGVGFDGQGRAYYMSWASSANYNGYFVLTSTTGITWGPPHQVVLADYTEAHTHARLAVDSRPVGPFNGSLYVLWDYYKARNEGVWLRYSRDQGRTWSADVPVSDVGHEATKNPAIAVAGNGTVYTAFPFDDQGARFLYLDRSTDGGASWGTDQRITSAAITATGALDDKGRDLTLMGSPVQPFEVTNLPFIAVSPQNAGTVYVVWNDGRWDQTFTSPWGSTGPHGDIAFTRTTDGGASWSAPIRLNDDPQANGVDQFFPTIAVSAQGVIGVTWHDRRDDPQHYLYDLYYTQSTDGGMTWSPNQRVSDGSSSAVAYTNGKGVGVVGDYDALVFGPDYVLPSWEDTRAGQGQEADTDRGVVPGPTPGSCTISFTDVDPNAYYATAVQWLACQTIVSGYPCGGLGEPCDPQQRPYFRPYNTTTRGQISKMVVLGQGWAITTPTTPTFADVPGSATFYPYIETAYAHGVISGYPCGGLGEPCDPPHRPYFRPGANVTRGQLTKIIVNAKGWGGLIPPTNTFADVPASDPFFGFIERAVQRGLISGYPCGGLGEPCDPQQRPYFRTGNSATRSQLSKILYTALIQP